jgi:hypothetical protein
VRESHGTGGRFSSCSNPSPFRQAPESTASIITYRVIGDITTGNMADGDVVLDRTVTVDAQDRTRVRLFAVEDSGEAGGYQ